MVFYKFIYIYTYTRVWIHTHTHTHTHTYIYTYIFIYLYLHLYLSIFLSIYLYIHIHTYTYISAKMKRPVTATKAMISLTPVRFSFRSWVRYDVLVGVEGPVPFMLRAGACCLSGAEGGANVNVLNVPRTRRTQKLSWQRTLWQPQLDSGEHPLRVFSLGLCEDDRQPARQAHQYRGHNRVLGRAVERCR